MNKYLQVDRNYPYGIGLALITLVHDTIRIVRLSVEPPQSRSLDHPFDFTRLFSFSLPLFFYSFFTFIFHHRFSHIFCAKILISVLVLSAGQRCNVFQFLFLPMLRQDANICRENACNYHSATARASHTHILTIQLNSMRTQLTQYRIIEQFSISFSFWIFISHTHTHIHWRADQHTKDQLYIVLLLLDRHKTW